MSTVRVLIVEDERIVARDLQNCLEILGYQVPAIATSGEMAILLAHEHRPDVVLMDIRLDGEMDGIQAAQVIWHELTIPIVFATGYSDEITVQRAAETEMFGYILKPIKERDLYTAIQIALRRSGHENRLKEQYYWALNVLREIGDAVIVTNAQKQIKFLNLVAERLTGWHLEAAMERPLDEVLKLVDLETQLSVESPVDRVLSRGEIIYLANPVLLITRTGRQIPIADSAAPLRNNAGDITGVVLVFREFLPPRPVDEPSEREPSLSLLRSQILEQQIEEMQRLTRLKDDFLSMVSHELRSPISNIKMSIRLLEMNLDRLKCSSDLDEATHASQVNQYLDILRDECDRELNIVNSLLEMQRFEAETIPLEPAEINIREWLTQIIEAFKGRIFDRQQDISLSISETVSSFISDPSILTQMIGELLTNACKYSPPGATISVMADLHNNSLRFTVKNPGDNLSPEVLVRIFDKFYRLPGSDRWNQGGTGLGLALVKKQVNYLGGSITAESDNNEVRFIAELPMLNLEA